MNYIWIHVFYAIVVGSKSNTIVNSSFKWNVGYDTYIVMSWRPQNGTKHWNLGEKTYIAHQKTFNFSL